MLRTSFRSEIHATDSTCSGCTAKSAADKGTAARRRRDVNEQSEQQQRVDDVEDEIGDVMGAGREPEELHVDEVRQPRQRMPVGVVERGERPRDGRARQPVCDVRVLTDVDGIVELDEIGAGEAAERKEGQDDERSREQQHAR